MRKYAAIYARESLDRSGRAENVADQEAWGREYAASKWPGVPVRVFTDNDISAVGKPRQGYEDLRAAIRRGEVAHVWAAEQSRFERDEIGWFTVAAELAGAGLDELHTRRDGVIPVRGVVAGIKAVVAAEERRRMIDRINDRLDRIAERGDPPGSRPFGYAHAVDEHGTRTYVIVDEQAAAIRLAAEWVLAGWSLSAVAAELRRRGVTGPHRVKVRSAGGLVVLQDGRQVEPRHPDVAAQAVTRPTAINATSVRKMLTMPTVAGHRVHRGRDLGPGSGNWPPILGEDTWQEVRRKLSRPRIVKRADGGTYPVSAAHSGNTGRRYLLTGGLAVCGVCGHPLTGSMKQRKNDTMPYLLCHPRAGGRGCTGTMLEPAEKHVEDELWKKLDDPRFLRALASDRHAARRARLTAALRKSQDRRIELAGMLGDGTMDAAEFKAARDAQAERETALQAELDALPPPRIRTDISAARKAWPGMNLGERREFVRLFIEKVTLNRAVPGRKGFDPGRVQITWRGGTTS